MTSRRTFLRASALLLPPLLTNKLIAGSLPAAALKPVVVSTWDSGAIANGAAWPVLQRGGRALDAVEAAGIAIENDVNCCVGLGGNPDRDGFVTLDACIMDEKANCGSVAFLERIKHPVSVARKVMENSPHVMLVGTGAQQFALANGFTLESGTLSASAEKTYRDWLKKADYKPIINIENQKKVRPPKGHGPFAPSFFDDGTPNHDTMGTVALDAAGNLSGMCTTSGMAFKLRGRLGDSPLIGAGLFVDNEVGAVTCSGQGEEVIRMAGSHTVIELMRQGLAPAEACKQAVERIIKRDVEKAKTFQVGFIALGRTGEVGAYAVQPGFSYTLTNTEQNGVLIQSPSYFK
ncbi:isoaspartyl peptidase/L-asparaginase family protein [Fibrivirga algicola]|uniref:N(4)-(Beta-N-acetylglucosaminyl)-L-asparaginase n=1 Tax=Fibrivirga algicola TaxID=2950420 RepID=A0ABX0QNU8_9BACT|nr:N(4)-(beta-N-acetylglucosaminyl)-L-asparaginase [Fibrivirga algicola]ARK11593.1 glycosylasparaginase [Fibrella sp. ES10-3-2-2]NID12542.1 N(4)-(beta-N-acetylglucosaminyl)-L-asparaginase [Fibrivirga algicola]